MSLDTQEQLQKNINATYEYPRVINGTQVCLLVPVLDWEEYEARRKSLTLSAEGYRARLREADAYINRLERIISKVDGYLLESFGGGIYEKIYSRSNALGHNDDGSVPSVGGTPQDACQVDVQGHYGKRRRIDDVFGVGIDHGKLSPHKKEDGRGIYIPSVSRHLGPCGGTTTRDAFPNGHIRESPVWWAESLDTDKGRIDGQGINEKENEIIPGINAEGYDWWP